MRILYYIGLDVHKKTIAYCIKIITGEVVMQGVISADRRSLRQWQVIWVREEGNNTLYTRPEKGSRASGMFLNCAEESETGQG